MRTIWRLDTRNDVKLIENFGMLSLIYVFNRARAAEWLIAFRGPSRRSTGFEGWELPDALTERLVAHLKSPAFDPTAIGGDQRA